MWRKPDEWASLIYKWAVDTGHTNTICTVYELLHGENTEGEGISASQLFSRHSVFNCTHDDSFPRSGRENDDKGVRDTGKIRESSAVHWGDKPRDGRKILLTIIS